MVQEDVTAVRKTLTPLLSVIHQYLGELLCNDSVTSSTDRVSIQPLVSDKSVVANELKGETSDTSVGECISLKAFFFNL